MEIRTYNLRFGGGRRRDGSDARRLPMPSPDPHPQMSATGSVQGRSVTAQTVSTGEVPAILISLTSQSAARVDICMSASKARWPQVTIAELAADVIGEAALVLTDKPEVATAQAIDDVIDFCWNRPQPSNASRERDLAELHCAAAGLGVYVRPAWFEHPHWGRVPFMVPKSAISLHRAGLGPVGAYGFVESFYGARGDDERMSAWDSVAKDEAQSMAALVVNGWTGAQVYAFLDRVIPEERRETYSLSALRDFAFDARWADLTPEQADLAQRAGLSAEEASRMADAGRLDESVLSVLAGLAPTLKR